jgi:hypothetical protein
VQALRRRGQPLDQGVPSCNARRVMSARWPRESAKARSDWA